MILMAHYLEECGMISGEQCRVISWLTFPLTKILTPQQSVAMEDSGSEMSELLIPVISMKSSATVDTTCLETQVGKLSILYIYFLRIQKYICLEW